MTYSDFFIELNQLGFKISFDGCDSNGTFETYECSQYNLKFGYTNYNRMCFYNLFHDDENNSIYEFKINDAKCVYVSGEVEYIYLDIATKARQKMIDLIKAEIRKYKIARILEDQEND